MFSIEISKTRNFLFVNASPQQRQYNNSVTDNVILCTFAQDVSSFLSRSSKFLTQYYVFLLHVILKEVKPPRQRTFYV